MTVKKHSAKPIDLKALVTEGQDFLKTLMKEALQEVLETEMTELLGAGHYERGLVTRIGKLELRVPRDRNSRLNHYHATPAVFGTKPKKAGNTGIFQMAQLRFGYATSWLWRDWKTITYQATAINIQPIGPKVTLWARSLLQSAPAQLAGKRTCWAADVLAAVLYNYLYKETSRRVNP